MGTAKTASMRSEEKTTRVRRKLRVLREAKRRARSVGPVSTLPPALGIVTAALSAAITGYELCARRTRDTNVAVAVKSAAASVSALLDTIVREAALHGVDVQPRVRMGDRLRWDWLASTGSVIEGASDGRVLDECARGLAAVVGHDVSPLGIEIASRVRLASAEAWSLASAVAAGARWRSERPGVAFLYAT